MRVTPGKYIIRAEEKTGITLSKPFAECEVKLGSQNDCSAVSLRVGGFQIKGKALSYDEPLEGVKITLLPANSDTVLKEFYTDSKGEYFFENVSSGKYRLNATVSEAGAKYKIEKSMMNVEVNNNVATVEEPFIVAGFSIRGKVINTRGYGIKDVIVKIDGERKATTNDRGFYKLDEIVPGDYILEGLHDDYLFEPMKIVINPHSATIPELVVSEYKLCGQVMMQDSEFPVDGRSVFLKDKQGHQTRVTSTDESGNFCFDVKPLEYVVSADIGITEEERSNGLRLSPLETDVNVVDKPITNLQFKQMKFEISGSIECMHEGECDEIEVSISNPTNNFKESQKYSGGNYKFQNLLPANYTVSVNKPEFCWGTSENQDGSSVSIDLGSSSEEQQVPSFKHKGYAINYEAFDDIDVEIAIEGENRKPEPAVFKEGKHTFCYKKQGKTIVVPKSCYKFDKEFYTCDDSDCNIVFNPVRLQVQGTVILESDEQAKESVIRITELTKEGDKEESELKLTKSNQKNEYNFEYYSKADSKLTIVPVCTSLKNDKVLFYPITRQIDVKYSCIKDPKEIEFEARKGLVLTGHIEGNITGSIQVTVKDKKTNKVIHEEMSKDGKYKVGPLYDDQEYEVNVAKEGYNFIPHKTKKGVFVAEILSFLQLSLIDKETKEPIQSVLVAVSSGRDYRNKSYSNDNGAVEFPSLYSGKYSVRPISKEFKFDSETYNIEEGETKQVILYGTRTAFSVYGRVSLISGDSVGNIVMQAKDIKSSNIEEAFTDSNGNYRLKGLIKGKTYEISIKQGVADSQQQIRKSMPATKSVHIEKSDIKDVDFAVILPSNKFYIKGVVNFEDDDWKSDYGKIELFIKGNSDGPISRQKIGLSRIFTFTGLPLSMTE
jgi:hypothetical protein